MDTILCSLKWYTCLTYINDAVVFAGDFETHVERLWPFLMCLANAGLQLSVEKCRFAPKQLTILARSCLRMKFLPVRPDYGLWLNSVTLSVKKMRNFIAACSKCKRCIQNSATIMGSQHSVSRRYAAPPCRRGRQNLAS